MRHPARTGLVVQMHYNTLADPDDLTDSSTLSIRPMAEPPSREAAFLLFGVAGEGASDEVDEPPFEVPLGARGHVESYTEYQGNNSDGVRI